MKRLLLALPLVILLLLNACGNYPIGGPSPNDTTAVIASLTASVWTPTISPTPAPSPAKIVEWMNTELSQADSLEQTLDAKYLVVDVSFLNGSSGLAEVMRVDIRCECANGGQCCYPERTFIAAINSMKKRNDKIIEQVPATVGRVKVICYDHMNQFATMSVSWADVKGYLQDQINGYQFGSRVVRGDVP